MYKLFGDLRLFLFCMDYIVHIRNICMCVSVDCELMPAIFYLLSIVYIIVYI